MGDLDSIAFSSSRRSSSLAWNFHNPQQQQFLGVFNADMSQYHTADMRSSSSSSRPAAISEFEYNSCTTVDHQLADHFSTGYLEDVLFEFSSKRRRLLMFGPDEQRRQLDSSIKNCWTSNLIQYDSCCQNFDTLTHITKCNNISDMKTPEEAISETYDSSSSSQKLESTDNQWTPEKGNLYCIDPIFSSGDKEKRKKRVLAKVVYPFALVKPGGFEGDMTLNDINERILMPPTRPVRHPVGDFACRPLVSPDGPGLSGKSVVAFTRIQTQGRGTITIIRTRG